MVTIIIHDAGTTNVRIRTDISKLSTTRTDKFTVQTIEGIDNNPEKEIFGKIKIGDVINLSTIRNLVEENGFLLYMGEESSINTGALRNIPNFSATPNSNTQVTLSWSGVTGEREKIMVQSSINNFSTILSRTEVAPDATSLVVTGLTKDTDYFFRIKTLGDVDSSWSIASAHTQNN